LFRKYGYETDFTEASMLNGGALGCPRDEISIVAGGNVTKF
jgi:hypothetical protein